MTTEQLDARELGLVPVISLKNYERNTEKITRQIQQACESIGFFYLSDHGMEQEVQQVMDYARIMFSGLTLHQKRKFQMRQDSGNRGYCQNSEEELQKGIVDNKEAFNVNKVETDDGKNWPSVSDLPDDIKDFQTKIQSFFNSCHDFVSNKVLNCLAMGLGWNSDFFQKNHTEKPHTLRLLHYPPARDRSQQLSIAAGEHSDYGTITLLFQDMVGGLQVRDLKGNWVNVSPIKDTIVVNIADLLQKWTDGRYVSTKHRVVQKNTDKDRYSIAFFVHPNRDTPVKDTTAGEYLDQRLRATHSVYTTNDSNNPLNK